MNGWGAVLAVVALAFGVLGFALGAVTEGSRRKAKPFTGREYAVGERVWIRVPWDRWRVTTGRVIARAQHEDDGAPVYFVRDDYGKAEQLFAMPHRWLQAIQSDPDFPAPPGNPYRGPVEPNAPR